MSDEQADPKGLPSKNKKSTMDSMIMGAIIGTAIGSAIGVSVAPKKGSETRGVAKETATGIFKFGKALLGRLFKKKKEMPTGSGPEGSAKEEHGVSHTIDMKKIPNEMEIIPKADPEGLLRKKSDHD